MAVCNTFEGLNLEIPIHENELEDICWSDGVKIVDKAVYYSIYNDINTYVLINEKISISSDHISNPINISRSYDILYDLSVTTDSAELLSVIYSSISDVLYQIGLSRIICEYVIPKLDLYLIGNGMKYKLADNYLDRALTSSEIHYRHIIPIIALPYTQISLLVRTLDNANNGIIYTFTAKGGYLSRTHRNKLWRNDIKLVDVHDEWKTKLVVSDGVIKPIVYNTSL